MSASASAAPRIAGRGAGVSNLRKRGDRFGDRAMYGICLLAALLAIGTIFLVGYEIVHGAIPAIEKFGLGFVTSTNWQTDLLAIWARGGPCRNRGPARF